MRKKIRKYVKATFCTILSGALLFMDVGVSVFAAEYNSTVENVTENQAEEDRIEETDTSDVVLEVQESEMVETMTEDMLSEEIETNSDVMESAMEEESEEPETLEEDIFSEEANIETVGAMQELVFSETDIAHGEYKEDGNNITWVIDADGKLIVEGTGDVARSPHSFDGMPWYAWRDKICASKISVTGMTDASYMFYGCGNMVEADVSNLDTSKISNMSAMFYLCRNLTILDVSHFDTANVTKMDHMFGSCESLVSLDISCFSTSNVTDMRSMFDWCWNLTNLDVSHFDTGKVTSMDRMFYECLGLKDLDVSCFDTSSSTDMGGMFGWCENLTSLDVSGFNTDKVTDMNQMFCGCKNLTNLDVSGFNTSKVTDMNQMFSGCKNLASLDVSHFDTGSVTDMSYMFMHCNALASIDVSHFETDRVTNMAGMFAMDSSAFMLDEEESKLTNLNVSNFNTDNVINMGSMFKGCRNLQNLNVSHFKTDNVTTMDRMFQDCHSLEVLDIGNFDTGAVIDMSYMFTDCLKLKSLDLSTFDTRNVINMEGMFWGNVSLEELNICNFDTDKVTSMAWMFSNCRNLRELDLSNFNVVGINSIGAMLRDCDALLQIYTPKNLSASVELPSENLWYDSEEKEYTELPQNLAYSILLARGGKPTVSTEHIAVTKINTLYQVGDIIDTKDIVVRYYASDGTVKILGTDEYTTNVTQIDTLTIGEKKLEITFNKDNKTFTAYVKLTITERIKKMVQISGIEVKSRAYNKTAVSIGNAKVEADGSDITDKVTLVYTYSGTQADGSTYEATPEAPINAGNYKLIVAVSDNNKEYTGSAEYNFAITKAPLTITVRNMKIKIGAEIPKKEDYQYNIVGLFRGDQIVTEPTIICDITDTAKEGRYEIFASGADAGMNYEITYQKGILTVSKDMGDETEYTVVFNLSGHGNDIIVTGVQSGNIVEEPEKPTASGYRFLGWYQDRNCTRPWNFEQDTVQEDMTLYAGWLMNAAENGLEGANLSIQEIPKQIFTENAIKPSLCVYSGDGTTLLKQGKDYNIKCFNNIEADTKEEELLGGINENGKEGEGGFTKRLAYVVITGKGNYQGTIYQNFHIDAASISENGEDVANGFTLKYKDQLAVNKSKAQKPFVSLKYKKAMKAGTDFEVKLTTVAAYDAQGSALQQGTLIDAANVNPAIPSGYSGSFKLSIKGLHNYDGEINKVIYVADKSNLMKNVKIVLGKNLKKVQYTGEEIILTPAYYDADTKKYYAVREDGTQNAEAEQNGDNVFIVKCGREYLKYGIDYTISSDGYTDNDKVGTATLTLTGIGKYAGTKSVTFRIVGNTFGAKNISVENFQANMSYTGKALSQNQVILKDKNKSGELGSNAGKLVYGKDYSIQYKNNVKKGTATMTFIAKPESGYSGSFKKTFKVEAAELTELTTVKPAALGENVTYGADGVIRFDGKVIYSKEGAKPSDRIQLQNQNGMVLKEGTDYTVSYVNNKEILQGNAGTADSPVMILKGRGNYKGTVKVNFRISRAGLNGNENLTVTPTPVSFQETKAADYKYQPKIKVTDGKKVLTVSKDYNLEYQNCTQIEVEAYLNALEAGTLTEGQLAQLQPQVVITAKDGSCYQGSISVGLDIYKTKLTQSTIYTVLPNEKVETVYTGSQIRPEIAVYYGDSRAVKEAKRDKVTDERVLTDSNGKYKLIRLQETNSRLRGRERDYSLVYGTNIKAGKSKGSITVIGNGLYGGKVTVKFTIQSRNVYTKSK